MLPYTNRKGIQIQKIARWKTVSPDRDEIWFSLVLGGWDLSPLDGLKFHPGKLGLCNHYLRMKIKDKKKSFEPERKKAWRINIQYSCPGIFHNILHNILLRIAINMLRWWYRPTQRFHTTHEDFNTRFVCYWRKKTHFLMNKIWVWRWKVAGE